jgi:hypothetical protein
MGPIHNDPRPPLRRTSSEPNLRHIQKNASQKRADKTSSKVVQAISSFINVIASIFRRSGSSEQTSRSSNTWSRDFERDLATESFLSAEKTSHVFQKYAPPDTTPKALEEGRGRIDDDIYDEYAENSYGTDVADDWIAHISESRFEDSGSERASGEYDQVLSWDSYSDVESPRSSYVGSSSVSEVGLESQDGTQIAPERGWFESLILSKRFSPETCLIAKNVQELLGPTREYPTEKIMRLAEILEKHPELAHRFSVFLESAFQSRYLIQEQINSGSAFTLNEDLSKGSAHDVGGIMDMVNPDKDGQTIVSPDEDARFIVKVVTIDLVERTMPTNIQTHTDLMGFGLFNLDVSLAGVPVTAPDFREKFYAAIKANDDARPTQERLTSSDQMIHRVIGRCVEMAKSEDGFIDSARLLRQKIAWVDTQYNELKGLNKTVRVVAFKPPQGPVVEVRAEIDVGATGVLLDLEESARFLRFIEDLHGLTSMRGEGREVIEDIVQKCHDTQGKSLENMTYNADLARAIETWRPPSHFSTVDQKALIKVAMDFVYNITSELNKALFRA